VDGVAWDTRRRLATVSGDLQTVGVHWYLLAPAGVCATDDRYSFFEHLEKKVLQILVKYEPMDLGLMKKL
jgi:hypothetical protein